MSTAHVLPFLVREKRFGTGGPHDAETRLWSQIAEWRERLFANHCELGRLFSDLRRLYSERGNSGDSRRSSFRHGTFEREVKERGYSSRRVREWISDYEAATTGNPTNASKRKARRVAKSALSQDVLSAFAALLPFEAAQAAFREAARIFHPDHGGNARRMQQLNDAWKAARPYYAPTFQGDKGAVK
jgi:hypothetical protein